MRKSLITTAVLGALAAPSFVFAADAAPAPDLTVAYNVGLYSQYIFRGLTQTDRGPALQGGVDLTHSSGFYLGAWASNISWLRDKNNNEPDNNDSAYTKGGHLELDIYGGYRYTFANGVGVDLGALQGLFRVGPVVRHVVVGLGHAHLPADDVEGQRHRVLAHPLALAAVDEFIHQLVGKGPAGEKAPVNSSPHHRHVRVTSFHLRARLEGVIDLRAGHTGDAETQRLARERGIDVMDARLQARVDGIADTLAGQMAGLRSWASDRVHGLDGKLSNVGTQVVGGAVAATRADCRDRSSLAALRRRRRRTGEIGRAHV